MPCTDCLEQQKILIRLTSALHEREQQNQELTNKFQKYKLQTKAKFAQLRHQILDNTGNEDVGNSNRLSNLLLRLDETEGQLSLFRDQIDDLKIQLDKKDREKVDSETQIKTLQQKLSVSGRKKNPNRKNESASSDDDHNKNSKTTDSNDQIQQMYAQLVYKDAKIVELSRHIDEQEQKIMDWQEASRDRDEVNKAKTKAIQILQEQLNRFVNKKRKDQAIQTDGDESLKINQAASANTSPAPGRAVAFYRDQTKKDDEESSFTTDVTANDIEAFDLIRNETATKDGKNIDKLNNRLSGLLQQVESMQRRVIKNELEEFEKNLQDTSTANQPVLIKKKKEKKVTFDFSEQQRSLEVVELQEKLQKTDLACSDLREENDELRLTISELEERLDERIAKNEYYEKMCSDLEIRLEKADRNVEVLNTRLEETINENESSTLRVKSQHGSKIKELEEEVEATRKDLTEKHSVYVELEKTNANLTDELKRMKEENDKTKITVRNLTEELQLSYVNCSKVQEELKRSEAELSAKGETVKILENLLKQSSSDKEALSKLMEEQKRDQKNVVFKTKAQLSVRIKELEEELNEVKRVSTEGKSREISLRQEYETLEETFRLVITERDLFLKQKNEIRKDLDELKEVIETSQEVIDFLENDLQLTYSEMEDLRRHFETDHDVQRAEVHRETSETRLKFKAYVAKMRALQKDNERLDEEMTQLNEKCEELKNEKYVLATELENLKSKMDAEQEQRRSIEESYGEIYNVYERSSKDASSWLDKIADLESVCEQKTQELLQIAEQLRQKEEILTNIRQQTDTLTVECNQCKQQNQLLLEEKQEIEAELQKLWQHDSSLKKLLADLESQFDAVSEEKSTLTNQNRDHVEQAQQITSKFQSLMNEKDVLLNENLKLKDQLSLLESNSNSQTSTLVEQTASIKSLLKQEEDKNGLLNLELERMKQSCRDLTEDKKLIGNKLESACKVFDNERTQLLKEKHSFEKLIETKTKECKRLEETVTQTNLRLQNCLSQIEELSNTNVILTKSSNQTNMIERIENEKNDLITFLDAEQSTRKSLERELYEQQKVADDFLQQLQLLSDKLKLTESRVEEMLSEKNELEQQLTVLIVDKAQLDNVCTKLTEEIQQLKVQNEQLSGCNEKNVTLQSQVQSLQDELDLRNRQASEVECTLQKQRDYITQEHCNTIDNLRSFNEELQSNLALKDSKIAILGAELSDLKSKIETFQRNNELESVVVDAPNEKIHLYEQVKHLQTNNESLKMEKEKLIEERQTLCNEIINLNTLLAETENQVEAQKIVVEGMSCSIDAVVKENESLKLNDKNDVNELLAQKQALEEAYQQLSSYYTQLQNAYAVLYAQFNEKQTIAVDSEATNLHLKTESENENLTVTDNLATVSKIRSENEQNSGLYEILVLQEKIEEMETKINNLETEKISLETKIQSLEAENWELEEANDESNSELEWKIQKLETENSSLVETTSEQETTIDSLRRELESKERHFDEEKRSLLIKLAENEANEGLVKQLEGKIQFLGNKISQIPLSANQLKDNESSYDDVNLSDIDQLKDQSKNIHSSTNEQLETELNTTKDISSVEKQKYEHEIFILKEEVRGLLQHISTLVAEIDNHKAKYRRSEERTNEFDAYFEKLTRQFEETSSTDALLREEIVALKQLCQNFDTEKSKIAKKLNDELVEKTNLVEKITIMETEAKDKSEKIAALEVIVKQIMDDSGGQNSELIKQLEVMKLTLTETIDEKNRLHEKLRNLFSENDILATEKEELDHTLKLLREEMSSFETLKGVQSDNKQLNEALNEARSSLTSVQESLRLAQTENENLLEKINNCQATIEVLNEQIKCYAEQMSISEEAATKCKLEAESWQQKLSDMEEIFSKTSMSNEELASYWSNKCEEIENQFRQTKNELESLKTERASFFDNSEKMRIQIEQSTETLKADLDHTVASLEAEKARLTGLLEDEKRAKFVLQCDHDSLVTSKTTLEETLKVLTSQLEHQESLRKNESNAVKEQLLSYTSQLDNANKDLYHLKVTENQLQSIKEELEVSKREQTSLLESIEAMKLQMDNVQKISQSQKADFERKLNLLETETSSLIDQLEEAKDEKLLLQHEFNNLLASKTVVDESLKTLTAKLDYQNNLLNTESHFSDELKSVKIGLEQSVVSLGNEKNSLSIELEAEKESKLALQCDFDSLVASKFLADESLKILTVQFDHQKNSWSQDLNSLNEQLSNHKSQLDSARQEIMQLRELESLHMSTKSELKNLQIERSSLCTTVENMKMQITSEEQNAELLKAEFAQKVASFAEEKNHFSAQLEEEKSAKLVLQHELDNLVASKIAAEDAIKHVTAQLDHQKSLLKNESHVTEEQLTDYKAQLDQANEELNRLKEENFQLTKGTNEVSKEFDHVKQEYNRKMASLKESNEQLSHENKRLSTVVYESDASCNRFKQKIQELNVELAEKNQIKEAVQRSASELTSTKEYVQRLEKEKEYLIGQLNEAKTSFGQIQNECQMLRSEIEKISGERLSNTKLAEDLKKASQDAQIMVSTLEHERSTLSKVQRETGELKEQFSHTERQIESYRLKLAEGEVLKEKLKGIEMQLERLSSENVEFSKQERKNRTEISKLTQELVSQKNDNTNLSRKLEESVQECLRHQDKCRSLEAELESKSSVRSTAPSDDEKIKNLISENVDLQSKLKELQKRFDKIKNSADMEKQKTKPAEVPSQEVKLSSLETKETKLAEVQPRQRYSPPSSQLLDSGVEIGTDDDNKIGTFLGPTQKPSLVRRRPFHLH